jgi:hypothetical protein
MTIPKAQASVAWTRERTWNAQSRHGKRSVGTLALATAVLGGFMLFADASNAKAADWGDHSRDRQVRYTEWRAQEAAERFGYNSREARHWRHESHEAREREKHFRHEYLRASRTISPELSEPA